eukprot:SRR837773.15309.p1 GENE.SRR837773.15309~~SRR837773.15309.p1  ORF type:complete len:311 (-),score=91.60 SRR837773.15309:65-946(-)
MAVSLDAAGGMRLLDLRRHQKLARVQCCPEQDEGQDGGDVFGSQAEEPLGRSQAQSEGDAVEGDELPRDVIASSTGFCVVCEAAAPVDEAPEAGEAGEAGEAEAGAEAGEEPAASEATREQRSCLVFFDFGKTLRSLYPGLPPKVEKGGAALAEAFGALERKEAPSLTAPPAIPEAAATAAGAGAAVSPTARGSQRTTPKSEIVELTAENLKRIGGTARPAANDVSNASQGGMVLSDATPLRGGAERERPGRGAGNWQVSVRRSLRASVAQKEPRLRHIHQRMTQLMKELSDT